MTVEGFIFDACQKAVEALYGVKPDNSLIQIQLTRKDFEGDYTIVAFPLLKISKKKPEDTAHELGAYLVQANPEFAAFNVVKGFLNLSLANSFGLVCLQRLLPMLTMALHQRVQQENGNG